MDENARLEFIVLVGINTNEIENFGEYLSCISRKVRRVPVSSKDITSEQVNSVAKQVVANITLVFPQQESNGKSPYVNQHSNAAYNVAQNPKAHEDVHISSVYPETEYVIAN